MKKLLLIAALIVALLVPFPGWAAELNNVTAKGVDGNLVFYDVSGNAIMTLDAANRKLSIPSGSVLETLGSTITLRNVTYTLPAADGAASTYLKTNGSATLSWASPTSTVAWDDIGDPDADATIAFGGYKETISSTLNAAGATLSMTNTTADLTSDVSFLDLTFTDDGDANGFFVRGYDNAGDLKFSIGAEGKLTITGTAEGTDAMVITGGDLTLTNGDVILASGDLSVTGNFTLTGSFYQTAIASAAAGNVNLTVDAAGNGTITIGGTSTGATIVSGAAQLNGNVDIGNAATDTLTITSIIDGSVTLDDGATDSPSLILKDATDETATFVKKDGANLQLTTTATEGLQVITGNLWVGNGSPGTAAMDGEDFYVNGDSEFDGSVQVDGATTLAGAVTVSNAAVTLYASEAITVTHAANGDADDLTIDQTGASNSSLLLKSAGTGTDAIGIAASAGGITMSSTAVASAWTHTSTGADDDLTISVAGNTDSSLILTSAGSGTDAVTVSTTANSGDIVISSHDKIDIDSVGTFALNAAGDTLLIQVDSDGEADDLTIKVDGDDDSSIVLDSDGTGADAVKIGATNAAGGIDIDAGTNGIDILATGGAVAIGSTKNAASSIALTANGGADETIVLTNTQGTGAGAISLTATAGGITLTPNASGLVTIAGNTTTTGSITGDGGDALAGFLKSVVNDVDAYTVTVGDSGKVITNAGNDGDPVGEFTLPAAAIGLNYCFTVMAAQELRVIPAAGDAINVAGSGGDAAEYWTANAIGEALCIVAVDVNNWIATSYTGTWTQQTPP